MRVLLVIAEMGVGGAERVVAQLARGLGERGDEVVVAAAPGDFDRLLAGSGCERVKIAGPGRAPRDLARAVAATRKAIAARRPDVIHAHNVKATAIAAAARAFAPGRPPLLASFHGVAHAEDRRAALLLRSAALVACVSRDVGKRLAAAGFPSGRLRYVRNAVEPPHPPSAARLAALDRGLGLEAGAPVVSIVGRLVPPKAHERFIAAAALIAERVPECRFLVVGDGPRRAELERLARSRGLADRLTFTGARVDAIDLIARSDVIVFSSSSEGMPVVALESMAAGVPVVSTDVEGMRELLADDAGVVVASREPAALADAVAELLASPARRAQLGRRGRERVGDEYTIAAMVDGYRDLYGELTRTDELPLPRRS